MSKDVFEGLAEHLDAMPQGFPRSESGVEVRLLKKVSSEEEAEIAAQMKMMPEGPDQGKG